MTMRVLVAMSGGVDSSVAAALLVEAGHDVEGATMKLWGGDSDSGCCSVADVADARRVAQQLSIVHHVFAFGDDFDRHVVEPYVADHVAGRVPNPCIECNRHLKLDRFLQRALVLGFDAIATGHHAQVTGGPHGPSARWHLRRGADADKDQSYVLHVADQTVLSMLRLPIGHLTKSAVRADAARLGLRTANKPDSQDVCFITSTEGRARFLAARVPLHPAAVFDRLGAPLGSVAAVETVTLGQRKGLGPGVATAGEPQYVVDIDVSARRVVLGPADDLLRNEAAIDTAPGRAVWPGGEPHDGERVFAQCSAHGPAIAAVYRPGGRVRFVAPARVVASGQSIVLYRGEDPSDCLGGGPAL